jgi:hypothetical protein
MRRLQMGLERKIETTLEPWLCYYCGQCSTQCPREADPGETMMSLRRWLITRYDFTGIARLFYKSKLAEILTIILVALGTGFFLVFYGNSNGTIGIYNGKGAFLPATFIHRFDLVVGSLMGALLLINVFRMWYFIMIKGTSIPVSPGLYLKHIFALPWHFFSQKRYAHCETQQSYRVYLPWLIHLGLMLGYVIMLVLVMVYVEKLQHGPEILWSVHVFGYLATIGLVIGTIYFIRSRIRKSYIQYKKTHSTDWVFVILLLLIVWSGIVQHVLHRTGYYEAANITYVIHLMFVVPWLLRMPFTKWSHLAYRPLAMYLSAILRDADLAQQSPTQSLSISIK